MASEPHTPWAHERRNVSVPSSSHLAAWSTSSTTDRKAFTLTLNVCQYGFLSRSGSYRLTRSSTSIMSGAAVLVAGAGAEPAISVLPFHGFVGPADDGLVVQRDLAVGLARDQRVLHPVDVVAPRMVDAHVGASALGTGRRADHQRLGQVDEV